MLNQSPIPAAALAVTLVILAGCADDDTAGATCARPDAGVPAGCVVGELAPLSGDHRVIINKLSLGKEGEGFDLDNADCDNDRLTGADNALWGIGGLADPLFADAVQRGSIALAFELFGLDDLTSDACVDVAMYRGRFPTDRDGDKTSAGGPTAIAGLDCDDTNAAISPTAKERRGNRVDDDCDGKADEDDSTTPPTMSTDSVDADGDGQTMADGDCDDRAILGVAVKRGAAEVCGDGRDNDCDGKADEGCLAWSPGSVVALDPISVTADQSAALVTSRGARVERGVLIAGPTVFSVRVEVSTGIAIQLDLSEAILQAPLRRSDGKVFMSGAVLGGVLSAGAADASPNRLSAYFGEKDDSMLDVLLAMGAVMGLPQDAEGRVIPDVDADGDGLERFWDADLDGRKDRFRVDTCVDGDGTVVRDTFDSGGKVTSRCTDALDAAGRRRFVDGWSITFHFDAAPVTLKGIAAP